MKEDLIFGRNPVLEAILGNTPVDRLYLQDGSKDAPIQRIKREAAARGLTIRYVEKKRLDELTERAAHQGCAAQIAAYPYAEVEDILEKAKALSQDPFLILLDGIEDPHNFGAILRTANQAGAHGIIIPKDRACPLTGVVAKVSAGAVNHTPVARVANLVSCMEKLKKEGLWFAGADAKGEEMYSLQLTGPMGLVIGSEGKGLSRLVKEHCDFLASIPMFGQIDSLNASVAAGILSYEIVRQRILSARERSLIR